MTYTEKEAYGSRSEIVPLVHYNYTAQTPKTKLEYNITKRRLGKIRIIEKLKIKKFRMYIVFKLSKKKPLHKNAIIYGKYYFSKLFASDFLKLYRYSEYTFKRLPCLLELHMFPPIRRRVLRRANERDYNTFGPKPREKP